MNLDPPDKNCITLPDGSCVGKSCMHDQLPLCMCHGPLSCFGGSQSSVCRLKQDPEEFKDEPDHPSTCKCEVCRYWGA